MANRQRGTCVFNELLQKKYPYLRKQRNKTNSDVHCKICSSNFCISNGGLSSIRRHISAGKHLRALREAANSNSHPNESKSISNNRIQKIKCQDVPSGDDIVKEDLDCSIASNQQETDDFETYWCDQETTAETNSTTNTTSTTSSLYLDQDQDQKPIHHNNQCVSTPRISNTYAVQRNGRTLSVQQMKMFEAELRVWQRKGEAIVKLMETVGHDKEMWEIINKQSKLHERERDRIREEYDILSFN